MQLEFREAENKAEQEKALEHRRAIREGRVPTGDKSEIEKLQEEEREHIIQGLESMGRRMEEEQGHGGR